MDELDELYQELIIDHSKSPRNFGAPAHADRHAEGYNPLCGDHLYVWLDLRDGKLENVRFAGNGCAISTASASLMTEALKGTTPEAAEALFQRIHALVTDHEDPDPDGEDLGKLAAFAGVRNFPMRVKCATLAWHTLRAALRDEHSQVTTE